MEDLIIIGGGPGGMNASLYAHRAGLKTKLVEGYILGGAMNNTGEVDNYLGLPSIQGGELSEVMGDHLAKFSQDDIIYDLVEEVKLKEDNTFEVVLSYNENSLHAKAVVIATGCVHKRLGIEGEEDWEGRGISYCATCDGAFFKGKDVAVIGGGDTAVEDAIYLAGVANKVNVIHRRDAFRAEPILSDKLLSLPNVNVIWNAEADSLVIEDDKLTGLNLKTDQGDSNLKVEGVFIAIGVKPVLPKLSLGVDIVNQEGFIKTNENMETSVPGLYAIGDIRETDMRQIVTALGDGANSAKKVADYLSRLV